MPRGRTSVGGARIDTSESHADPADQVAREPRLVDNQAEDRYELWVGDDRVGTIEYSALPEGIVLIHTEIDPAFDGKGFGGRLVHDALADVRSRGLRVVPQCSFVRSYLGRHPDQADILAALPAPTDSQPR